jgi:hypothetical protein
MAVIQTTSRETSRIDLQQSEEVRQGGSLSRSEKVTRSANAVRMHKTKVPQTSQSVTPSHLSKNAAPKAGGEVLEVADTVVDAKELSISARKSSKSIPISSKKKSVKFFNTTVNFSDQPELMDLHTILLVKTVLLENGEQTFFDRVFVDLGVVTKAHTKIAMLESALVDPESALVPTDPNRDSALKKLKEARDKLVDTFGHPSEVMPLIDAAEQIYTSRGVQMSLAHIVRSLRSCVPTDQRPDGSLVSVFKLLAGMSDEKALLTLKIQTEVAKKTLGFDTKIQPASTGMAVRNERAFRTLTNLKKAAQAFYDVTRISNLAFESLKINKKTV